MFRKYLFVFLFLFFCSLSFAQEEDDLIGDILMDEEEILMDKFGGSKKKKKEKIPQTPKASKDVLEGNIKEDDLLDLPTNRETPDPFADKVDDPIEKPVGDLPPSNLKQQAPSTEEFEGIDLEADIDKELEQAPQPGFEEAPAEKPLQAEPVPTPIPLDEPAPTEEGIAQPETVPVPTEETDPVEDLLSDEPDVFADDLPDDATDDLANDEELDSEIAGEDEGPPPEPPFVDEEEDTSLAKSVLEAEEVGNTPSFITLPFEETKDERLARLRGDNYYKDLVSISKTGVHSYEVEASPIDASAGFRLGPFPAPALSKGFTYEEIYGTDSGLMVLLDYELKVFKSIGHLGLKLGTGFFTATGSGQFASTSVNAGKQALEKYSLFVVPLSAGLIYRLEYWDNQFIVPYAEGGADYFGIVEIRDDGADPGIGGAPALHVAGGLALLLDKFAPQSIREIDRLYGVNHIYLVIEGRQFIGLNSDLDFTGLLINGGIGFDF